MVSRANFLAPDNSFWLVWHLTLALAKKLIKGLRLTNNFNEVLNNTFPITNPVHGAKFTFGTRKLVPLTLDFNTPVSLFDELK